MVPGEFVVLSVLEGTVITLSGSAGASIGAPDCRSVRRLSGLAMTRSGRPGCRSDRFLRPARVGKSFVDASSFPPHGGPGMNAPRNFSRHCNFAQVRTADQSSIAL